MAVRPGSGGTGIKGALRVDKTPEQYDTYGRKIPISNDMIKDGKPATPTTGGRPFKFDAATVAEMQEALRPQVRRQRKAGMSVLQPEFANWVLEQLQKKGMHVDDKALRTIIRRIVRPVLNEDT
jgi:hypothetical protein